MEALSCSTCGGAKTLEELTKDKRAANGRANTCKTCHNARVRKAKIKARGTWDGKAQQMVVGARSRSLEKGLPKMTITRKWVLDQLEHQDYKCCKTGIPFNLDPPSEFSKNPYCPSLDQIEPGEGYLISNIQIVANVYNTAKSIYTDEVLLAMAKGILKTHEQ